MRHGEVGPWRVTDGATEITERTVVVTSATTFARVKRATGPGPHGWVGDFAEETLALVPVSSIEPSLHLEDEREIRCARLASGVVTALDPVMRASGGTWWPTARVLPTGR